jgi:hypothetical protein
LGELDVVDLRDRLATVIEDLTIQQLQSNPE